MEENAVLGPVDPQRGEYPAVSIMKISQQKKAKDIEDKTLILIDVARKAQSQVSTFIRGILTGKMDEGTADKIATTLTEVRWTHDYPITYEETKRLGLPVTVGLP